MPTPALKPGRLVRGHFPGIGTIVSIQRHRDRTEVIIDTDAIKAYIAWPETLTVVPRTSVNYHLTVHNEFEDVPPRHSFGIASHPDARVFADDFATARQTLRDRYQPYYMSELFNILQAQGWSFTDLDIVEVEN